MKTFTKLTSAASRTMDAVVKYLAYLAAALLLLMAISICLDVVLRYAVNRPLKWVFEATEYALLFITFLATTWVLQKNGHVNLDLVLNSLGRKAQAVINTLTSLIMAGVCLVFAWSSTDYTIYLYRNDITIVKYYTIPQFAVTIIIPLGFFLLFVQSLRKAYFFSRATKKTQA